MADLERLRRHSRWLATLTLWLFAMTALVLLVPFGGMLTLQAFRGTLTPGAAIAISVVLPSIFYLFAIWSIRTGFREFGRGGTFGPVMAAGCARAGYALAIGATLSAVGMPNLEWALSRAGMLSPRSGALLKFDTAYLAVGVVGLALILLGGLLTRAAELQAEAADLRDELGGFV